MAWRPERTGEGFLCDLETTVWFPTVTGVDSNAGTVYPKLRTASPYEKQHTMRVFEGGQGLGDTEQISFGIPFLGTTLNRLPVYIHMAGACTAWSDTGGVAVQAFIARCDNATLVTTLGAGVNPCSQSFQPPLRSISHSVGNAAGTNYCAQASVHLPVMWGYFDDAVAADNKPIIVGWRVVNQSGASANITVDCTMFGYRYTTDTDAFDPSR